MHHELPEILPGRHYLAWITGGFLAGVFYAVRIEQVAGYYECRECGHRYVPTYWAVNLAQHMGRTRYMTCPECHKKSWQKKVLSKNKAEQS